MKLEFKGLKVSGWKKLSNSFDTFISKQINNNVNFLVKDQLIDETKACIFSKQYIVWFVVMYREVSN